MIDGPTRLMGAIALCLQILALSANRPIDRDVFGQKAAALCEARLTAADCPSASRSVDLMVARASRPAHSRHT